MSSILGSAAFYIVAVIVVLGLFGLAFWLTHRSSRESQVIRKRGNRLAVLESLELDAEHQLVLIRRDGVEHLLLLGQSSDLVVEPHIARGRPQARPENRVDRADRPERPAPRPPERDIPPEPPQPPQPPSIPDREQRRQAIAQRLRRASRDPGAFDDEPLPPARPRERDRQRLEAPPAQLRPSPPPPLPDAEEPAYADRLRLRSSLEPDPVPDPFAEQAAEPESAPEPEAEQDVAFFDTEPAAETEPVMDEEPATLADPEPGPQLPRRSDSPFAPLSAADGDLEGDTPDDTAPRQADSPRRAGRPAPPSSEEPIRPPPPTKSGTTQNATTEPDEMEEEIARLFGAFPNPRQD